MSKGKELKIDEVLIQYRYDGKPVASYEAILCETVVTAAKLTKAEHLLMSTIEEVTPMKRREKKKRTM